MNKYFTPVTFKDPEPKVKEEKKKTLKFPSKTAFTKAIKAIRKEINLIQIGQSEHSHYAIQLKDGRCPAIASLERFAERPTEEGMKQLLELSEQDFGLRVRRYFEELLNKVLETNNG